MELFFYDVDADYVKYLKATEKAKRGFTRVPDVEYENERKMVCGVVLVCTCIFLQEKTTE